jgi:hypothetical protein
MTWQLPDTYHSAGSGRGTATFKFYEGRDILLDRPVKAYQRWLDRIPGVFATAVLGQQDADPSDKSYEVATLKNYQSLMPLAHDARKPMFDLRSADGALGSTQAYVQRCYQDFKRLSDTLLDRLANVVAA